MYDQAAIESEVVSNLEKMIKGHLEDVEGSTPDQLKLRIN